MKKTLITIAGFAVLLFALLGAARLLERARPEESAAAPDEPAQEEAALWEQTPDADGATLIRLGGDYVTVRGAGHAMCFFEEPERRFGFTEEIRQFMEKTD